MGIRVTRLVIKTCVCVESIHVDLCMSSTGAFNSQKPETENRGLMQEVDLCGVVCRVCDSAISVTCIHVDPERSVLFAGLWNRTVALYNLEQCTQITKLYYNGDSKSKKKRFLIPSHTHTHGYGHEPRIIPSADLKEGKGMPWLISFISCFCEESRMRAETGSACLLCTGDRDIKQHS